VPTLSGPRSIESVLATTAVVGHTSEGAVSLLDGPTLRVRRVLRGFGEPRYVAAHPRGRYAYVTDSGLGELAVLDVVRATVTERVELGGPARHIAIDRAGRRLWVALGTKAAEVAVLTLDHPARPRFVARIRPPFLAHDVGFAPGGGAVWVTSGDRGTIAIYDPATHRLLVRLPADAPPQHVTFGGATAYVTSGDDGMLRVHGLNGRLRRSTRVPAGSYNVQHGWEGQRILTPSLSRGTLCVLDASGRLVRRVRAARSSHDACFVVGS
jgi:DNA-binding beta-propeller fold protein YncE